VLVQTHRGANAPRSLALRRDIPDRIPTFEWFIDDAVLQALCGSSDSIEVVERLDLDAVNVRADYREPLKIVFVFLFNRKRYKSVLCALCVTLCVLCG